MIQTNRLQNLKHYNRFTVRRNHIISHMTWMTASAATADNEDEEQTKYDDIIHNKSKLVHCLVFVPLSLILVFAWTSHDSMLMLVDGDHRHSSLVSSSFFPLSKTNIFLLEFFVLWKHLGFLEAAAKHCFQEVPMSSVANSRSISSSVFCKFTFMRSISQHLENVSPNRTLHLGNS